MWIRLVLLLVVPLVVSTPAQAQSLDGLASTYANDPAVGWIDHADNNIPALSGATNDEPGIAVYNRQTLGGWWRVTSAAGVTHDIQQTDIGPAPWTNKVVDINAVAARTLYGYSVQEFPTGEGSWHIQYLGRERPATVVKRTVDQQLTVKQSSNDVQPIETAQSHARAAFGANSVHRIPLAQQLKFMLSRLDRFRDRRVCHSGPYMTVPRSWKSCFSPR